MAGAEAPYGFDAVQAAAARVRSLAPLAPEIALVLGSGLGGLGDRVEQAVGMAYGDILHFPRTAVPGHAGQLALGRLAGRRVAVLQGRPHLYEGHSPAALAFPLRLVHALGARALFVSNAAGGLNPVFAAGDLMLIDDHISLPGLAGLNPLVGPNDERLGPRFPDMSDAYDPKLRALALQAAARVGVPLRRGVYETAAELRMLRTLGADAVGMSTALEVVAARHLGMRVLGLSCITDIVTGAEHVSVTHEEVLRVARESGERFDRLVEEIVRVIPGP